MNTLTINTELQKHLQETNAINEGWQYVFKFENNYGASVVQHAFSYGHESGQWEIAVLKDGELTYETPITQDVLGWQTQEQVMDVLFAISKLPAA
jgi:hypothetical protein